MKRKELEIILQEIPPINDPRPELEQYSTPAKLAADILFTAFMSGDIEDKVVADFGCGSGVFAIGAAVLGAKEMHAFDVDEDIIRQAQANAANLLGKEAEEMGFDGNDVEGTESLTLDSVRIMFVVSNVRDIEGPFDTVIMNPPFGAQNPGADLPFLLKAINTAKTVYTIHQSATLDFLKVRIQEYGGTIVDRTRTNFPIPHMFSFHDEEIKLIDVTILKISGVL